MTKEVQKFFSLMAVALSFDDTVSDHEATGELLRHANKELSMALQFCVPDLFSLAAGDRQRAEVLNDVMTGFMSALQTLESTWRNFPVRTGEAQLDKIRKAIVPDLLLAAARSVPAGRVS